jgi:hypothetical protein
LIDARQASEYEAALAIMKDNIRNATTLTNWGDRWVKHAKPIASEPNKFICWLTGPTDEDLDHQARLLLKATLHPVDRFFMQTRRRISLAERPVISARKQRRVWNGYGAYVSVNHAAYLPASI